MYRVDDRLKRLIGKGKKLGYLTYSEICHYLPDQAVDSEKLDNLLTVLEELDIDIRPDDRLAEPACAETRPIRAKKRRTSKANDRRATVDSSGSSASRKNQPRINANDDPLRIYLIQMGEIPLLTRKQEIEIAKIIDVTRKRFRRELLENHMAMTTAIAVYSNKRVNKQGAIAGMLTGLLFTYGYIEYFKGLFLKWAGSPWGENVAEHWLFGISPEGIGVIGMSLNFIVAISVSYMTAPPPDHIQHMVEQIRVPRHFDEDHS